MAQGVALAGFDCRTDKRTISSFDNGHDAGFFELAEQKGKPTSGYATQVVSRKLEAFHEEVKTVAHTTQKEYLIV